MNKRKHVFSLLLACILAFAATFTNIEAYGPSTLCTAPQGVPAPGVLYARAMQASNGKMYATFEQYTTGVSVFPIYQSVDNGANWRKVGDVKDTHKNVGMRWEPHLYELPEAIGNMPAGTLLCAGLVLPYDRSFCEIDLYRSNDEGKNWTYVSTIAEGKAAWPGGDPIWEPCLIVANHKLICYYSDERDPKHGQKLVHQTTSDGVHWSSVVNDVALTDSTQRPGMAVVSRMPNGNYIMTYEIVGSLGGAYYQISSDPERWNVTSAGTKFGNSGCPYNCVLNNMTILSCAASNNIYINGNSGIGGFQQVSCVIGTSYSRCLVPLKNNRLFAIGAGWNGSGLNSVVYGDMQVPGVIAGQPVPSPSTTPVPSVTLKEGWYRIKSVHSSKYLQVQDNKGADTQNVEIGSLSDKDGQKWFLSNTSNGTITLKSALGDYMLDIFRGDNEDGTNVEIYKAQGHTPQQFILEETSTKGIYTIHTLASNGTKSIDVTGLYTADGTNVCQWSNTGRENQQWVFEPVEKQEPTVSPSEAPSQTPSIAPTKEVMETPDVPKDSVVTILADGNSWSSGYNLNLTLKNTSSQNISNWKLVLSKEETSISSIWCASKTQSDTDITITPESYNAGIASNSTITFGFGGNGAMPQRLSYKLSYEQNGTWTSSLGSIALQ